jgi:hypothetical protein
MPLSPSHGGGAWLWQSPLTPDVVQFILNAR